VAGGDPLLQRPHLAGDRLHEPLLALGQGRDDGIGQLEGRAGVQPSRLDPPSTARVSRRVASGVTAGLTGPCTVTR
jgi:hypothetical protein